MNPRDALKQVDQVIPQLDSTSLGILRQAASHLAQVGQLLMADPQLRSIGRFLSDNAQEWKGPLAMAGAVASIAGIIGDRANLAEQFPNLMRLWHEVRSSTATAEGIDNG